MLHCKERDARPCFHYDSIQKQHLLNEFLKANSGFEAEFLRDGMAIISSLVKGSNRHVHLYVNAWIRVISPGQFSAISERAFEERFVIISSKPVEPVPATQTGVLSNITHETRHKLRGWKSLLGIGK